MKRITARSRRRKRWCGRSMRDDAAAARRWQQFLWLCDALRPLVDPERSPPEPLPLPRDPADSLAPLTMASDHAILPALIFATGNDPALSDAIRQQTHNLPLPHADATSTPSARLDSHHTY